MTKKVWGTLLGLNTQTRLLKIATVYCEDSCWLNKNRIILVILCNTQTLKYMALPSKSRLLNYDVYALFFCSSSKDIRYCHLEPLAGIAFQNGCILILRLRSWAANVILNRSYIPEYKSIAIDIYLLPILSIMTLSFFWRKMIVLNNF